MAERAHSSTMLPVEVSVEGVNCVSFHSVTFTQSTGVSVQEQLNLLAVCDDTVIGATLCMCAHVGNPWRIFCFPLCRCVL